MPVFGGVSSTSESRASPVKAPAPEREMRSPSKYRSPVKIQVPPASTPADFAEEKQMREAILQGQVRITEKSLLRACLPEQRMARDPSQVLICITLGARWSLWSIR